MFLTGACSIGLAGTEEQQLTGAGNSRAVSGPVASFGQLKVTGSKVTAANGSAIQLKGMSLFWSQWAGSFYNSANVTTLANDWKATVVRAAMGVNGTKDGYLVNPTTERDKVIAVVDAAIANGIYVIVDWHDHDAHNNVTKAKAFFKEMASKYQNTPNIIWEIYNEPLTNVSWGQVKSYAEAVIGEIRAYSNNIVIVGSPTWSQDVHSAAANPITKYSNVAYTLHFYAGTHKQSLRDRADQAMEDGIAIMVTEWGTCDASGNGGYNAAETQLWLDWMAANKISWANWSLFNKNETASVLVTSAGSSGPWSNSLLTTSGKLVKAAIGGSQPTIPPSPSPSVTPKPSGSPKPSVSPSPSPIPTAGPGSIKVQYSCSETVSSTKSIKPDFKIVNTGSNILLLETIKLRYYFTADNRTPVAASLRYSTGVTTANVIQSFGGTGNNRWLEIGFKSGAGSLAAGASVQVKATINDDTWELFTQNGDHSFDPAKTSYADWIKVTGFISGVPKWGTAPY